MLHALPLPAAAADRLIAAHDGDVALLYLYLLRGGAADTETAAAALCRTAREIEAAGEKLRRMGLAPRSGADPERLLPPEDRLPEYRSEDLSTLSRDDPMLRVIFDEAGQVFGRKLSPQDMKMLAGIHQHLGMPAEVVLLLLHYCGETAAARKAGSVPSPRSVEKTAYDWANREILTLEQAEEYIRFRRERRTMSAQIREALNIRGRELTKSEQEHVSAWLDMGFGPEAVAIAYDRMMINISRLNWSYLDKILRSWHEKKLHTPEEIQAGDGRRPQSRSGAVGGGTLDRQELSELINKI